MLTSEIPLQTEHAEESVEVINPSGDGLFLLVCEHASNFIPAELNHLGLDEDALESHIAWDPGARDVAVKLSALLDAPLVAPQISRLVYDCNRPPHNESAVTEKSENTTIPGNSGLSSEDRAQRNQRFFLPFNEALDGVIQRKIAQGIKPVLITIHSFTPLYDGVHRDTEIGFIHDRDTRLADEMLGIAATTAAYRVGRNTPYGPSDGVTQTLIAHALPHNLLNVMVEIRNDLIGDAEGCAGMAEWVAMLVKRSVAAIESGETRG